MRVIAMPVLQDDMKTNRMAMLLNARMRALCMDRELRATGLTESGGGEESKSQLLAAGSAPRMSLSGEQIKKADSAP
jgi:hypothetical protein